MARNSSTPLGTPPPTHQLVSKPTMHSMTRSKLQLRYCIIQLPETLYDTEICQIWRQIYKLWPRTLRMTPSMRLSRLAKGMPQPAPSPVLPYPHIYRASQLNPTLPPLKPNCPNTRGLRPRGHSYEVPECRLQLCKNSCIIRCLYRLV